MTRQYSASLFLLWPSTVVPPIGREHRSPGSRAANALTSIYTRDPDMHNGFL
jgi:hypothetical protein